MRKVGGGGNAVDTLKRMQKTSEAEKPAAAEEISFSDKVDHARDVVADVGSDALLAITGAHIGKSSVDGLIELYTSGDHQGGSFSSAEFNYMFGLAMGTGMSLGGSLRLVHHLAASLAKNDE